MSVVGSCSRSGFYGGFIVADDRQKIAVADETDRTARRAPDRRLIDRVERGAAIGLTHDPRMRHSLECHIMNKSSRAEQRLLVE